MFTGPFIAADVLQVKHAMTLTEKILAKHSDNTRLQPGANIWTNVDKLLTHDVCGPGTFGIFEKEFGAGAQVWDPEKVIIIPDHYIFTSDPRANRNVDILRQVMAWATQYSCACIASCFFPASFPIEVHTVNISTLLHTQPAGSASRASSLACLDAALCI